MQNTLFKIAECTCKRLQDDENKIIDVHKSRIMPLMTEIELTMTNIDDKLQGACTTTSFVRTKLTFFRRQLITKIN